MGGNELEGFVQLAGGILVGGYALYKMTQDDRQLNQQAHASPKKSTTATTATTVQTVPVPAKAKPAPVAVPAPTPVTVATVSHAAVEAVNDNDDLEEDDLPSWMSRKAPLTAANEAVAAFGKPFEASNDVVVVKKATHEMVVDHLSYSSSATDLSSEASEPAVPSWMSTKDPQIRPDELSESRGVTPVPEEAVVSQSHYHSSHSSSSSVFPQRLITVDHAVSAAAAALSDVVFVYPGGAAAHLGSALNNLNSKTSSVKVQVMDTRGGAGAAVAGAAAGGARVAVLAGSASLPEMLPALLDMRRQRLPVAVHVAAASVHDLALKQDLSGAMALRSAGVAILSSGSAQESADLAPVAHALAAATLAPVVHVFDGARSLEQLTAVRVPESLRSIAADGRAAPAALAGKEAAARGTGLPYGARVGDELLQAHGYRAFERSSSGDHDVDVAVVATGAVATVLRAELARQTRQGHSPRFAVVTVRLVRPWSAALLLEALPASARRVVVLEHALFADVAAALHSDAWHTLRGEAARAPTLLDGRLGPLAAGFSPAHARAVLANARSERPLPAFSVSDTPLGGVPALPAVDDGTSAVAEREAQRAVVAFASSGAAGDWLRLAGEAVALQLGAKAQLTLAEDPYAGDRGLVRAEMRIGNNSSAALPETYAVSAADVVLLPQDAVAACAGAAAALLRDGGALLLLPSRAEASLDEPLALLPAAARAELSRKSAQLVVLDARGLLERAVEAAGQEVGVAALRAGAQWMALVGALRLSEGAQGFASGGAASALQRALHSAGAAELGDALAAALAESLPLVDSFLAHRSQALLKQSAATPGSPFATLGAPRAYVDRSSLADGSELDAHSFASARSFGAVAASPIAPATPHHSGASSAAFTPRLRLLPADADGCRNVATLGRSLRVTEETKQRSAADEIVRLGRHHVALPALFPHKFARSTALKPAEREAVYRVRLTKNERLTPDEYSRNIFHLEFDISDTDLTYQIGDALGVYAQNDPEEVDAFIRDYGLDPNACVAIPARGRMTAGTTEIVSTRNLLLSHLDLWGKPSKRFYCQLAAHATSRYEHLKLMHTGTDDTEQFKLGVYETVTFADLLLQYRSAQLSIEDIVAIVPVIKARHYSIASAQALNPTSVHLLVVAVDWVTPGGRTRYGQCTRYLSRLDPTKGEDIFVAVDVISSVLRLPKDPSSAIIMVGLGTGMAPFRAFVQERKHQREQGLEVGPIYLYFGARHRHEEWLYGAEWDEYEREGLVTRLGLAFSRDQKEKIYIQHRMEEDRDAIRELFSKHDAHAYLCGPVWPVPDVSAALAKAVSPEKFAQGVLDLEAVDALKKEGRFVLEVY